MTKQSKVERNVKRVQKAADNKKKNPELVAQQRDRRNFAKQHLKEDDLPKWERYNKMRNISQRALRKKKKDANQ